jgi:hypothetical protein
LKRMTTKWTTMLLVFSMLVSLFVPMSAYAAAQLLITNLYAPNGPVVDNDIPRVTLNPISLNVTINGITDDQIADIYYEIYNDTTKKTEVNNTNKALKSTQNNNEITFTNVQLTEGLNKITVKIGTTSVVSSIPGWVYFTPVTNITDIQFNGGVFEDNQIYPKTAPYTGLNISGTAINATQVQAFINGNAYNPAALTRGTFTFVANTGRQGDINFTPGDNEIKFVAKNSTNYYNVTKPFVYDNGRAFAYRANVKQEGADDSTIQNLVEVPTVTNSTGNTSTNVTMSVYMKNSITATVRDYVYVDIFTLNQQGNYSVRYDFRTDTVSETGTQTASYAVPTITKDIAASTATADIFSVSNLTLPTNTGTKFQQVMFRFVASNGAYVESPYSFYFEDYTMPYINRVERIEGSLASKMDDSSPVPTQVSEFPAKFKIVTNDQAGRVQVLVGGMPYNDGSTLNTDAGGNGKYNLVSSGAGTNTNEVTITLEGIRDGDTTLEVVPIKLGPAPGYVENVNSGGKKTYSLRLSSAPYVIVSNLYSGMVINKASKLVCTTTPTFSGPCIEGRVVNLPADEYDSLQLSINGTAILPLKTSTSTANSVGLNPVVSGANGMFRIDGALPTATADAAKNAINNAINTALVNAFTQDGKKTIKFSLYLQGELITESSFDVFLLSDDVPLINAFKPYESSPLSTYFKAGTTPGTYVTNQTEVQLEGNVTNSNITRTPSEVTISYRKTGDTTFTPLPYNGTNFDIGQTITDPTSATPPFTQSFRTSAIPLTQYGDYTFSIVASNASGITVNRTITITREPHPYSILQPTLIKNEEGKDQANINKNFQSIQIQADKADSVVVGKEEARKNPNILNRDVFEYEVTNLKPGKNEIKFTVNRGTEKLNGSFILYHVNTPIVGAQVKAELQSKMKVFEGDLELSFPKDTKLMKNDRTLADQYLTLDRDILFGIANVDDGIVDKTAEDISKSVTAKNLLNEPTGHFKAVSKRFWVDAGTILPPTDPRFNLREALQGSGQLPIPNEIGATSFYTRNANDVVVPNKRGTITLKYDENVREDAWKYVAVYQYGFSKSTTGDGSYIAGWRNIGGVVDPKKNTITVPIDSFGYFQVMYMNDSFVDVTSHPWARDDLDTLYSKGLMNNKTPGLFLPDDPITRGEFVTMLVNIFELPLENEDTKSYVTDPNDPKYRGTFSDVRRGFSLPNSAGLYDFIHIEAAARAGIVRGSSNGLFLPGSSITRQDAAVMIQRAAELKTNTDPEKALASLQKSFTDSGRIDLYARGSVEAVTKAGLITGKPNLLLQGQKNATYRFDPLENMSRAEAAAVAMRVLKQQKKLPK